MFNETGGIKSKLTVYGLIVLALSVAYLPLLQGDFLYREDYNLWTTKVAGTCKGWYAYSWLGELGRPLLPWLFCAYSHSIDSLNDTQTTRFFGILLLALLVYLVSRALRSHLSNGANSTLVALTIATLPAIQILQGNITGQPLLIAVLLSVFAFLSAMKGSDHIEENWRGALNKYSFFAIFFFMVSLLIYQSSSMFYWVMVGALLTRTTLLNWEDWEKKIHYLFGIGFLSMGTYFVYAKVNFLLTHDFVKFPIAQSDPISAPRNHLITITPPEFIIEKLKWFLTSVLPDNFNLWSLYPTKQFAGFMVLLIICGAVIGFIKTFSCHREQFQNKQAIPYYLNKFSLVIILPFLCYMPALAPDSWYKFHRTFQALMPFVVILLYWALCNISLVLPKVWRHAMLTTILIPVCLYGIYNAHYNSMYMINFAQTIETRYIKSAFRQSDLSKIERIHVILLGPPKGIPVSVVVDQSPENRAKTGRWDWEFGAAQMWNDQNFHMWLLAALPDIAKEGLTSIRKFLNAGKISTGYKKDYKAFEEPTLVIDMNRLNKFY